MDASCSEEQVSWVAGKSPSDRKYTGSRETVASGIALFTTREG